MYVVRRNQSPSKCSRTLPKGRRFAAACAAGISALSVATAAQAGTATWSGGSGSWYDASNWTSGVPLESTDVLIDGGKTAVASTVSVGDGVGNSLLIDAG